MTTVPNIETFEHDIAEEIKRKEASISQIATASGNIENKETVETQPKKTFLLIFASLFIIFISIASVVGYFMYVQKRDKVLIQNLNNNSASVSNGIKLYTLMPNFDASVGRFISETQDTVFGYDMRLNNYSYIFSYVLKNELSFKEEAVKLFNVNINTPEGFKDLTIENQNMRILTDGTSTIVYAFINTDHLLISTSTEGILSMRSAIIR